MKRTCRTRGIYKNIKDRCHGWSAVNVCWTVIFIQLEIVTGMLLHVLASENAQFDQNMLPNSLQKVCTSRIWFYLKCVSRIVYLVCVPKTCYRGLQGNSDRKILPVRPQKYLLQKYVAQAKGSTYALDYLETPRGHVRTRGICKYIYDRWPGWPVVNICWMAIFRL